MKTTSHLAREVVAEPRVTRVEKGRTSESRRDGSAFRVYVVDVVADGSSSSPPSFDSHARVLSRRGAPTPTKPSPSEPSPASSHSASLLGYDYIKIIINNDNQRSAGDRANRVGVKR
uniref:Uncharacterized protein n=1 Tax=Steinernema glaseri TaxID=37863 RepID=A0A1I7XWP8_9BILA